MKHTLYVFCLLPSMVGAFSNFFCFILLCRIRCEKRLLCPALKCCPKPDDDSTDPPIVNGPCESNPCLNNGICTAQTDTSFSCACPAGWTGNICQTRILACASDPCQNGGTCIEYEGGFLCGCAVGWSGTLCQTATMDYCNPNPCRNGAVCQDLGAPAGYTCICPVGYMGTWCEIDIDYCAGGGAKCSNGGTCVDGIDTYTCICPIGYTGTWCHILIDNCQPNPCVHGSCTNGVNDYTCSCDSGWTGKNCHILIDNCQPNPCVHGSCTNGVNDYTCSCESGWTGENCDSLIDYCQPNPCVHGLCTNGVNDYTCSCYRGWTGKDCDTPNILQRGNLIPGEAGNDHSGESVSISDDGDTVAIGAPRNRPNIWRQDAGHVRVYTWNGGGWSQLGDDINGVRDEDNFGVSVSLSGNGQTLAIGATGHDKTVPSLVLVCGFVQVYAWDGDSWEQKGQDLYGEAANDASGKVSLSPDGNTLAIGAPNNDGDGTSAQQDAGHVRVYSYSSGSKLWTKKDDDIDGDGGSFSRSGAVSLPNANTVAIGSFNYKVLSTYPGLTRVFDYNGGVWTKRGANIVGESNDASGTSVALATDGLTLAVGAPGKWPTSSNPGRVRVYSWTGVVWADKGDEIVGEDNDDHFGHSISLSGDGDLLAIGGFTNDGESGGTSIGHVQIYSWDGNNWIQLGYDIDGLADYDYTGYSVSLSQDGHTLAVGAPNRIGYVGSSTHGDGKGHVRVFHIEW